MLFLFCVALWFILRGASCFKVFPCSLFSRFVIPFSIVNISLGEEGAGRAFVCLLLFFCACMFLSFFSSSWCRGLSAVCDCGTPWTFLLTFLQLKICKTMNKLEAKLCFLLLLFYFILFVCFLFLFFVFCFVFFLSLSPLSDGTTKCGKRTSMLFN